MELTIGDLVSETRTITGEGDTYVLDGTSVTVSTAGSVETAYGQVRNKAGVDIGSFSYVSGGNLSVNIGASAYTVTGAAEELLEFISAVEAEAADESTDDDDGGTDDSGTDDSDGDGTAEDTDDGGTDDSDGESTDDSDGTDDSEEGGDA